MPNTQIQNPKSKIQNSIDWANVRRILVVRLRSIGDTVLSTPPVIALRRFLPDAQIDVLLEDWVAPVLEGFSEIDNVITFKKDDLKSRLYAARQIRRNRYDVVFNLHGGTTATFFTLISGAKYRVGYGDYQYAFLHNRRLSSAKDFWRQATIHSAEQQLALAGFVGVPVADKPTSRLTVTAEADNSINEKLSAFGVSSSAFALLHPVAAFATKQWATENFARAAEFLNVETNLQIVAVATKKERAVLEKLKNLSSVPVVIFDDLTLPEITALTAKAKFFLGNDSGIAHVAAAVQTPSVVIFGSSSVEHWHPWTAAPYEIVHEKFSCQPCAGYFCKEFNEPRCILSVTTKSVFAAIEKVLTKSKNEP